jgi:hypothetical protein
MARTCPEPGLLSGALAAALCFSEAWGAGAVVVGASGARSVTVFVPPQPETIALSPTAIATSSPRRRMDQAYCVGANLSNWTRVDCSTRIARMPDEDRKPSITVRREGRQWEIGTSNEVDWISKGTTIDRTITSGIPPVFDSYATVVLPADEAERETRDRAMVTVLSAHAEEPSWWLAYLDTGGSDIVFEDAPKVPISFLEWRYVLVAAGPEQAATWRKDIWRGALPDIVFPEDRSWLISTLWDDDWTCVGGSTELVEDLLRHPVLHDYARRIATLDEDATPPGHTAF